MFRFLLPLIFLFRLIISDKTTFQAFYSPKTVDEIRYIVVALEKYIAQYDPLFKGKKDYLSTYNKNELTDYTTILVKEHCDSFENIEIFNLNIKIYPVELTPDSIIEKGERQFLYKWAINAEKFKRMATQTSHLLGGLIDYAQYMKTSELREYIRNTLIEYPVLNNRAVFDQEILNIKPYKESVFKYLQDASIDVIRNWINNLELYLVSSLHVASPFGHEDGLKEDNSKSVLQKNMYNVLKNHKELLEIESFLQIIDYKNIKYVPMPLDQESTESIKAISLGCEEYNRKQKDLSKSFRGLDQYHAKIPIENLKSYSMLIIKEYPELTNLKLIDDLLQNNKRQNFGKVQDNVNNLSRKELITYILNAKTIEGITQKHSEDLNTIFRLRDSELREMLLGISKRNTKLQIQVNMENTAQLNNDSLSLWLEQIPHNILGEIGCNLTKQFNKEGSCGKFFFDSSEELIRDRILTLSQTHNISTPRDIEKKLTPNGSPLYNGTYNYFKAISKETLFVWIKLFEQYHRRIKKLTGIIGGVTNKKTEKKYYIGKLFYYLEQYPQYKDPKEFDQFVGLYKVHEKIYSNATQESLGKIATALSNYHKRMSPNLQYSMNIDNYFPSIDKADVNFLYYYIFKIMAIYPELNIPQILEDVREKPETKDITEFINNIFGDGVYHVALNMQYYHNAFNDVKDHTNLREFDENGLKHYIQGKYLGSKKLMYDFPRLIFGQSEYLFWNYEAFFDRQGRKELITFAERMEAFKKSEKEFDFQKMTEDELKIHLKKRMATLDQLHDAKLFDGVINYVQADNVVKQDYIEKLNNQTRHKLIQFSLVVTHLNFLSHSTLSFTRVFNFLISATKNELIRFICNGLYLGYNIKNYTDLIVYTRQLFLDYGEQSVLDLVEFS